ncbi:MAG TPA: UbiA family prenyltransferase [Thermoplasmata archaeon]|nr:UbiA family prenyltransferase [Thermoplasmata archaeon]
MRPALQLVRIGNVLVSLLGTLVGGVAAAGLGFGLGPASWLDLTLAAISTGAVTAGGNILNDLIDREGDRVNHPERPLVSGAIDVGTAKFLAVSMFVLGAVAIVPLAVVHPLVPVVLAIAVGSLLLYEFRWKAVGFAGNLLVALLTGLVFVYGAAAVASPVPVVPFALMAFFATLSREVIKDMEDAEGDVGRQTLPRTRGLAVSTRVARGSVAVALILSPLPLLYLVPSGAAVAIIYLASVLVADGLFVVSVRWLPLELHREQTMSKVAMTVALIAFLVVAFR